MNKIPKINIAKLYSDDVVSKLKVATQIDEACRTYGCFIVKNHHISRVNIGKLLDKTSGFYNQLGHKKKMEMAPNTYNKRNKHTYRGYVPQSRNSKQNFQLFLFTTKTHILNPSNRFKTQNTSTSVIHSFSLIVNWHNRISLSH